VKEEAPVEAAPIEHDGMVTEPETIVEPADVIDADTAE